MRKEFKVGLLGAVALAVFYFGFNFLKGSDLFSTENDYSVNFEDVQGLAVSSPVTFNGVNLGRVSSLEPDFKSGKIKVNLLIKRDITLTDKTEAVLADDGLLGGKVLKLVLKPGKALADGGVLIAGIQPGMINTLTGKLDPTLQNADSLMISVTKVAKDFQNSGQALKILLASAQQSTQGVNAILGSNAKNVSQIVANASLLSANLNTMAKGLESQISPILSGAKATTDSLNKLQLSQTLANLNKGINSLDNILADINSNKGTLGKLKGDDSLYLNLDKTASSLNALLADMKANPKRYVHFSLFGRKK